MRPRTEHNSRGEKYCSGCKAFKPLGEFNRCARSWDGKLYLCKACSNPRANKSATEYYKNHRREILEKARIKKQKREAGNGLDNN